MKYTNRRKLVRVVTLIALVLAVCLAGFGIYAHYHKKDVKTVNNSPTAEDIKKASDIDAQNKKDFIDANNSSQGQTTPNSNGVTIDLSARKEADSTVTIITKLLGVSSGSCALTITNGTKSVSKTAVVIYQPEFSTCAGFSIPISSLGSGTWNISLTLTGASTGSKSITFGVN